MSRSRKSVPTMMHKSNASRKRARILLRAPSIDESIDASEIDVLDDYNLIDFLHDTSLLPPIVCTYCMYVYDEYPSRNDMAHDAVCPPIG